MLKLPVDKDVGARALGCIEKKIREGRVDDVRWVLTFRSVEDVVGLVEALEGMEEVRIVDRSRKIEYR